MFAAVGLNGTILTSLDGVSWTQRTSPTTGHIHAVAYSRELGLFVAAAQSAKVLTSPDGVTWTERTTPVNSVHSIAAVVWSAERGLFAAGASNGDVITSPDGTTWTLRSTPGTETIADMAWSPLRGVFVAVGSAGSIRTSSDGIAWTARTSTTTNALNAVAWSEEVGLFVVGAVGGLIQTSPTGVTWTARSHPNIDNRHGAGWSPDVGLYALVGDNGTIITSPDGVSWTNRTTPGTDRRNDAAWSPDAGVFAVVGANGTIVTSSGGVTWTSRTSGVADSLNGVTWAVLNQPPNAPTLDNPVGGATIDRTAEHRFAWDFNDPDTGDSQSAYRLYHRPVGASTWTVVEGTTPNTFHDFAAGYFTAGDHEWQVETADAQGEWGPRSASEFFTAATPPGAPTITDPTSGQTIPTESYPVQWSAPSQDGGYEWRRVADNAGSPDTSIVYDGSMSPSTTARSRSVAFPTNNRWEHVQWRIKDGGLWSEWASVRVEVSWTSPPAPSVTAVGNDTGGYIAVAIDNPPPVGDEPSVTSNDLYRREIGDTGEGIRIARGIAPDGAYNDYATASRQAVEYRARANGANQTSSLSAWAG